MIPSAISSLISWWDSLWREIEFGDHQTSEGSNSAVSQPLCECMKRLRNGSDDMRLCVFNAMRYAMTYRVSTLGLFNNIFYLYNSKCNQTCTDMWFRSDKFTRDEKQMIQDYFIDYTELFTYLPSCDVKPPLLVERNVLSGMVLFRMEVLPLFQEVLDNEIDMIPFLTRMVYLEREIRKRLSGYSENSLDIQSLNFTRDGHLSERIRKEHKWWNEGFADSEGMDATNEYCLTD
ncbi:hypothetical protein PENTCL1PPCAC_19438 [Pristionchus entomophagus]|uniref:NR LBD domain-containing protein n=1 Tax=Pristionchus entomophagus TaxID=358040 RepID=A0AAV5TTB5_9BILA|nr:hypothetical protein PENTCL1PPCAC_19438 [Pristionchus entomophagus]